MPTLNKIKRHSAKILLWDEDPEFIHVARAIFSNRNFQIISGNPETNIVDQVIKEEPDLIMMETWLPYGPEKEIIKTLKENQYTSNIPVILFSTSRKKDLRPWELGVDAFFSKPFDVWELVRKVDTLLMN